MVEAAGSLPGCGTPAETEHSPQHPSLHSVWGGGSEPVGQDEAPALGWLQPAAVLGSQALRSQAVCGCCGGHPMPQPVVPGYLWLLTRCIHGAPLAPGARGPLPLGLTVQCAPQCPVRGPACGGLLHDEAAHAGISRGTRCSFRWCPSRHGHIQPAGSQVRANCGAREAGALLQPATTALLP